jgi:hypothetical protein
VAPEQPEAKESKGGKPNDKDRIAGSIFTASATLAPRMVRGLILSLKRLEAWLASQGEDVSLTTCKRIVPLLVKNGKLEKGQDTLYRKGKNA